jgi:hypothetical protein
MTWQVTRTSLQGAGAQQVTIADGGTPLSVEAILDDWIGGNLFADLLAASPFEAFCWETPPLRAGDTGCSFECMVLDEPLLARFRPDPAAFADRFAADDSNVIACQNISGDATLIIPRPLPSADADAYGHLAAFLRRAPRHQVDACFRLLATTLGAALDAAPRWVSTAGLGVPWLHVRIDTIPKYYRWRPYCAWTRPVLPG